MRSFERQELMLAQVLVLYKRAHGKGAGLLRVGAVAVAKVRGILALGGGAVAVAPGANRVSTAATLERLAGEGL